MSFQDLLRDTIATLWAHKRRTMLTMFGIAWGIISITVMVAAGEGLGKGIQNNQETFGKDVMIVFAGHDNDGFQKELPENGFACGAKRFADTDLARPLADGDKHNVHHAEAAQKERGHTDRAHEKFHAYDNHAIGFGVFDSVPNAGGFFVARIEAVQASEGAANLPDAVEMRFQRPRRHQ